ncbi:hypothetical protein IT568_04325, partial [bacterium]|nr:hypothetical protein [bacterium]
RLSGNNFTFERYKEQNSDTTLNVWKNETHKGLVYSSSIGIAPKFNYFSLTPTFSYKADFVERFQKGTLTKTGSGTDSVAIAFEKGNKVRQTFSSALAVSTKIYGIRQVGFWKIEQVRHVVDPSVTFTYAPDFSKKTWNYFQEVKNDSGRVVQKVDKFGGNKTSVIGATSTNKTRRLDFSLGNKFQMKYFSGDSTRKQEKKIDLFDLNFSSSYNFEADSLKLGNLRTVFTAKPSQKITTTANTTHTFYAFNSKKYLFETSPSKVANLVNFSLDLQFLLSGGELQNSNQSNVFTKQDTSRSFETATSPQTHDKSGNLILRNKAIENLRVPWTLNSHLTWGMNRNERKGGKFTKDSQLIVSVASQLTPNWTMSYDATYDLVNQIIRSHEFNFVRTLHKWKLGFRWIPYGFGAGYFLKVGLDSPQLKDLKIQTHEGENLRDPF